jgi:hypothetical protein
VDVAEREALILGFGITPAEPLPVAYVLASPRHRQACQREVHITDRSRRHACRSFGTLLATIIAATVALPVHADDEAGPEDRARIAEALRAPGYDSFEEVEFDDGVWEVDDAVGSDGREYDLELDPDTLEIIRKEPE